MQFGMGVLNRNDLLALKIEKNAYLHETVWVETTASFIGKKGKLPALPNNLPMKTLFERNVIS